MAINTNIIDIFDFQFIFAITRWYNPQGQMLNDRMKTNRLQSFYNGLSIAEPKQYLMESSFYFGSLRIFVSKLISCSTLKPMVDNNNKQNQN